MKAGVLSRFDEEKFEEGEVWVFSRRLVIGYRAGYGVSGRCSAEGGGT